MNAIKLGRPRDFTGNNMKIAFNHFARQSFLRLFPKTCFSFEEKEYSFLFYKTEQYRNISNISENLETPRSGAIQECEWRRKESVHLHNFCLEDLKTAISDSCTSNSLL